MKNKYLLVCCLALLPTAALRADESAKPAPTKADDTTMIVDLRTDPAGLVQYGSWGGKLAASKSGLVVMGAKGAKGDGGFGGTIPERIDLSLASYFEIALGVVPGNEVPKVTIAFDDMDGTQFSAQIDIDHLVPGSPVWLRVKRDDLKMNNAQRGTDSLMDWSKIERWHIEGDGVTKKPMSVIFIALRERR